MAEGFHPNLRHVRASEIDPETAQSSGMERFAAISNSKVGSEKLWMGESHIAAEMRSSNHHHGDAETGIYVVSGNPTFVFLDELTREETRIEAAPGDYLFVPPYTPHREENNSSTEAVVVLARSTQDAIVINLASLGE